MSLPHTVVVYSAKGGVGTSTVAASLALLAQSGHTAGHTVLVDFDHRSYDLLGRPPYQDRDDPPHTTHHRDVHDGIDVVHYPATAFDAGLLSGVLDADPARAEVNAVIVDASTPDPQQIAQLRRRHPGAQTVHVTETCYLSAAASRDHVSDSGVAPDEIIVVKDPYHTFSINNLASWWGKDDTELRGVERDATVAKVIDAGMLGLTHSPGFGIYPDALAPLSGCSALPDTLDRRRVWEAINASSVNHPKAAQQLRHWTDELQTDIAGEAAL